MMLPDLKTFLEKNEWIFILVYSRSPIRLFVMGDACFTRHLFCLPMACIFFNYSILENNPRRKKQCNLNKANVKTMKVIPP